MSEALRIWELQKSIYRHLKKRAKSLEGIVSRELKRYEANQRKYANRKFEMANLPALLHSIDKSDVVYLGDFHSFDQNTRNLERLTRALIKQRKKFSLGVEFVHQEYQYAIEYYLQRKITEIEFLEEVNYRESWRFPWTYYRPFFEMARTHGLSILALNTEGTLKERDEHAAETIGNFLTQNPNERLLVLFGELHIVPNKLPNYVKKQIESFPKQYRQTIIHQNLDEVYWKLFETNIEKHNQIITFSKDEYSLQTAPPWIKYESMIYWYENLSDEPEFELHDYILNDGVLNLHSNVPENFVFLSQKILSALGLDERITQDELEDFNIYEHQKLNILIDKVSRLPKATLTNFLKNLVKEGRVFRIPFSNNYYCSSYSINRMTFLAGLHIQDILIRSDNINYEKIWMDSSLTQKFILTVKQNAMGYLSSKIINPFRKCDLYNDLLDRSNNPLLDSKDLEQLRICLNIIENIGEYELKDFFPKKSLTTSYEVGRKLGLYWGEIIYENLLIKDKESYLSVFNYLNSSNFEEALFCEIFRKLIPTKEYPGHRKRYF